MFVTVIFYDHLCLFVNLMNTYEHKKVFWPIRKFVALALELPIRH